MPVSPLKTFQAEVGPDSAAKYPVTSPQGIRIAVAGDVLSLCNPLSAWQENFKPLQHTELSPVVYGSELLSDLGRSPAKKATMVPLASIESSFSCHIAKG